MKKQDSMYGLWRRVHSHLREDADLEAVTEEANALLPRLEETESCIRDLIKQTAHLSKTLVGQLKNLAADFERQALSERSGLEQKLSDIQKTFEQKNRLLQKELDEQLQQQQQVAEKNAGTLLAVIADQNDLLNKDRTAREQKFDDLLKSFDQKNQLLRKAFEKDLQQQQKAAHENVASILGGIAEQNDLLNKDRSALDQKIEGLEKSFEQKNAAFQKQVEKNLQHQQKAADKNAGHVLSVVSGQSEMLEQERKVLEQKLNGIHE